jgi:hypothetical protein
MTFFAILEPHGMGLLRGLWIEHHGKIHGSGEEKVIAANR